MVVLPGFVDAHTHPVWSGNRVNEFAMKLASATYMEFCLRLDRMLRCGATLIEAKSGYGLETDTELKMLRVLHAASTGDNAHPVEIVSSYLGGHSVPDGMIVAEVTKDIVSRQIPTVLQAKKDGTISPEFIDVFCEKGVFEHDDTHRILGAGKQAGLEINFHGDEMHPMQSGAIAAALGRDYNPNAHCLSMALTMNMACVLFGMTMTEALVGATINAAASINRSDTHGSLEVGKQGDLVVMRATQWEQIIYEMGDPPIQHVVIKGTVYIVK
ncbi:unnamed protein product [Peronospora belbahrii]|uniref:Probable imidazolonepropionase n=1 Tax=Peronospora belbahrii TaxID=622444 RepID=A0AAU9KYZ9_9STRA|nr:unnamed protein product [Peronospora belbahrii]